MPAFIKEGLYCLVKELVKEKEEDIKKESDIKKKCDIKKESDIKKKQDIKKTEAVTYNLIGSCIDLAKFQADVYELQRILKSALGMEVICILTSETSVSDIERMGESNINLVLRREGVKAADTLKEKFHTDYVYGRPYGYKGTVRWLKQIAEKLALKINEEFIDSEMKEGSYALGYCRQVAFMNPYRAGISIGGNYDVVKGILDFATEEAGMKKKYVWCDAADYETITYPIRWKKI